MNTNKKRLVVAMVVLVFLFVSLFLYLRKDIELDVDLDENGVDEERIREEVNELDAIREERRDEEEYVPPTEDQIRQQIDELDALRRR